MADGADNSVDTSTQGGAGTQSGGNNASSSAGGTGGQESPWYSTLPEGVKDNPNIIKYGSVEELAQGHINASQLIGRDKLPMPKTDQEWRETYAKLGMPDAADKYEIPVKDYGIDPSLYSEEERNGDISWWKQTAHTLGLSGKQATAAYDAFMTRQGSGYSAMNSAIGHETAKAEAALRAEWGEAYDGNMTIANRALNKLYGPDVAAAVANSGLGRNPDFVRGLYRQGMTALEDLGIDKRGSAVRTPAQLAEEISVLQGHAAYFDNTHPEHESVVERVFALQKRMHPGDA